MKSFVYWLPGVHPALKAVEAFGVPALKGEPVAVRGSNGPPGDGRAGALCWREAGGEPWSMDPAAQAWRKVAHAVGGASGEYWIGFAKDAKPDPKALLRARTYAGDDVQTSAGVWKVPKGRLFPLTLGLSEAGEYGYMLKGDLAKLADDGLAYLRFRAGVEGHERVDDQWVFGLFGKVLGLNYSVGLPELAALEALDMKDVTAILDAFSDLPFLIEMGKKKVLEEPASPLPAEASTAGPAA